MNEAQIEQQMLARPETMDMSQDWHTMEALGWRTNVAKLAHQLGSNPAQVVRQLANAQRYFKSYLVFDRQDGLVEIDASAFD